MKNYAKRLCAVVLAVFVSFTSIPVMEVQAEEIKQTTVSQTVKNTNDIVKPKLIQIDFEQLDNQEKRVRMYSESDRVASQAYNNATWDKYSTNYYYNLLSDAQQQVWEQLDDFCLQLLVGTEDVAKQVIKNEQGQVEEELYCTGIAVSQTLTVDDIRNTALIFRMSNPQYYFLDTTILWAKDQQNGIVGTALGVYSKFANGQTRASETAKVKTKLNQWESQMSGATTEFDKAKKAHEIVMAATTYNNDAIVDGMVPDELDEQYITQSAYSALLMGSTVCAGYSMAYEMLCNSVGLDSITMTSSNHQWNKIRVEDSWYNVDCTWDDSYNQLIYTYFMKNDSQFSRIGSHTPVSAWTQYMPACTLTVSDNTTTVGNLPKPVGTVVQPTITVKSRTQGYSVTISCGTSGAKVYYTVNGNTPSVAYTKSKVYRGSFVTSSYKNIRAVAVKDTHLDSSVASATNTVNNISYQLNGGTNNKSNLSQYSTGTNVTLYNPTRKGYTFGGWYTSSSFSGNKVTSIAGISRDYTLYAKWSPIKYKVKFNKNGLKLSGSFSSKTYKYGSKYTLPKTSTKKKGYDLVWNTKKKGKGTSYQAGTKVKNLTTSNGKTITLYAKWQKHKYKISYQLKGGKNSSKNPTGYYITSKTIKLKNPTRKGYKFMGWYSDKKYKNKVTQIKKGTTGNKTLYAKWKKT